jgi:tetratricopeptide (TPR) repeat protein
MADRFQEALTLHRSGRLDEAAQIYGEILRENPWHADSYNLLGVIWHQKGDSARAVELIRRAIQMVPNQPQYFVNLATALRALGRHGEAIDAARIALDRRPRLCEAQLALALSLEATGQWEEAEAVLVQATADHPFDSRGPQALGHLYRTLGRHAASEAAFREALFRNANDGAAHLGLGTLYLLRGQPGEAESHLRQAVELLPDVPSAWMNYGTCLIRLGRDAEAVTAFEKGLERAPNDREMAVNLGQAYLGCGQLHKAENCFQQVLKFHPEFSAAIVGLGDVRRQAEKYDEAISLYEQARRLDATVEVDVGLSEALWEKGDVDRAIAVMQAAVDRQPERADHRVFLGGLLAAAGDLERAAGACEEALRLQPGHAGAIVQLARIRRQHLSPEHAALLTQAQQQNLPLSLRIAVRFALAGLADSRNDFAEAAGYLSEANALALAANQARGRTYDPQVWRDYIDRVIRVFDEGYFKRTRSFGVASDRPVFIIGLPRSGTTLVEQILASHPQVYGAGERRYAHQSLQRVADACNSLAERLDFLDRLTPELVRDAASWHLEQLDGLDDGQARRIVDKMPENYVLLGWIVTMFPEARIIHCRRDVRDVALSCWMTNFTHVRWANDVQHIAHRIDCYQHIMRHWERVLPGRWYDVAYEKLVADPEGESRKLVETLGLQWDARCLRFYESQRYVKTASVAQVRQPIYTRSVGRWRQYRDHLTSLWSALEGSPTGERPEIK